MRILPLFVVLMLIPMALFAAGPPAGDLTSGLILNSRTLEPRPVELRAGVPEAGGEPGDAVTFALDDGVYENALECPGANQSLMVNRFTPEEADYPILLDEVSIAVSTPKAMGVGGGVPFKVHIYQDLDGDGDPATNEELLASYDLSADTFGVLVDYELSPALTLEEPGDLLIAVAIDPNSLVVSIDTTVSSMRSWIGCNDKPEDPPMFPAQLIWAVVDDLLPNGGNWAIRAAGVANVLYDQLDGALVDEGVVAQDFEIALDAFDAKAADDFEVTSADGWTLDTIENIGFYNISPGPAESFNVSIALDDAGAPSEMLKCDYAGVVPTVDAGGSLTLDLPESCRLSPGTYWVILEANLDLNAPDLGEAGNGQYRWNSRLEQVGNAAKYREPLDGSGKGCTDWTDIALCFATGGQDLAFRLVGTLGQLIFADGFDSGDTSAWSSTAGGVVVVAGDLDGDPLFKLEVPIDGTATKHHVQSSHPVDVATYNAAFLLDANMVDIGFGGTVELARIFDASSNQLVTLTMRKKTETNYKVFLTAIDDLNTTVLVGQTSVGSSGTTMLELQWASATADGANDGMLRMLRNGNLKVEATMLDTDTKSVGSIRLGAPKGSLNISGMGGVIYFDTFSSFE